MTGQLKPGVFDISSQEGPGHETLFGIISTRMRAAFIVRDGFWYNKAGQLIGTGDLSKQDLEAIAGGLDPGEVFVAINCGEATSYRNGAPGSGAQVGPDELKDITRIVVVRGIIFTTMSSSRYDAGFRPIGPADIYRLLTAPTDRVGALADSLASA